MNIDDEHQSCRGYIDREIGHLRELLTQRLDKEMAALELQHVEYGRRFDILNHADDEARRVAAKTVSLEKFEDYVRAQRSAFETYRESQEAQAKEERRTRDDRDSRSRRAAVGAGVAVAGMLLSLALNVFSWIMRAP